MAKKTERVQLKGMEKKKLIELKKMKDKMENLEAEYKEKQKLMIEFIKRNNYQSVIVVADEDNAARFQSSSKDNISKTALLEFITKETLDKCTTRGKTYEYLKYEKPEL